MIKVYVPINQLHNFLIRKEPVQLVIVPLNESYSELIVPTKKLIFTQYSGHLTVEFKTFKKKVKGFWNIFRRR